ncbi:MAG: glycosyltransferase family 39 protein [Acidobacteriota bacterium]|nr:glycosyltransferase family 39 protein [Acidobacteriota bacterium]
MKIRRLEIPLIVTVLAALSVATVWYVHRMEWTLYNPDADAHLNIARRIVDSRTPGYDQIGTVWLPLPHLLTIPFVMRDSLWQSGLAGAIPSACCFVMAGAFLFAAVRRSLRSSAAAFTALGIFALNPNLLYLQSTPMTEAVFFGALAALLYFTILFRDTGSLPAAAGAGVAALAASLTRYEGWFLLPFAALYLWIAGRYRLVPAIVFCAIAGLGPIWWFAHNYWVYGDALAFYNGPWSASAIYQRALDQGVARYRGDHDWLQALFYYSTAAWICAGGVAVALGALGLAGILRARAFWPVVFLSLSPIFYVWSMHSSGTPIYVPNLWPNSYYNTRYGLAVLPLAAFCAGALVLLVPKRWRAAAAVAILCAAAVPWLMRPNPDNWICWKESQVNSIARRAWTREAAEFLAANYKPGQGILTAHGVAGVLRTDGIPLRESLNTDNRGIWEITCERPDLFLHEEWVMAMAGDAVDTAVTKTVTRTGPKYDLLRTIIVKDAPVVDIYRRAHTAIQPPAPPDSETDGTEKLLPYEPKQ